MVAKAPPHALHLNRDKAHLAISSLSRFDPWSAGRLLNYYDRPTIEYLTALFEPVQKPRSKIAQHARDLLFAALRERLRGKLPNDDVVRFIREIDNIGVIQTGPHCELCLQSGPFFGTIMPLLGARECGLEFMLAYTCATVKFEQKSKCGPGWFQSYGVNVNIF